MAPDLNSLPPSTRNNGSPSAANRAFSGQTPSPRQSISLAAAASINAGIRSGSPTSPRTPSSPSFSRHHERRRSSVAISLSDPAMPAPGELQPTDNRRRSSAGQQPLRSATGGSPDMATADPHHHRQPSLGELHQELEQEQEAQVNRLLLQITHQQAQIAALQAAVPQPGTHPSHLSSSAIDSTPPSERSPFSSPSVPIAGPVITTASRPTHSLSRNSSSRASRPSSRNASPMIRPLSRPGTDDLSSIGPGVATHREDLAYYQAESQSLTRENQMLKMRIRELEKMMSEMKEAGAVGNGHGVGGGGATSLSASAGHAPAVGSSLSRASTNVEEPSGEDGASGRVMDVD